VTVVDSSRLASWSELAASVRAVHSARCAVGAGEDGAAEGLQAALADLALAANVLSEQLATPPLAITTRKAWQELGMRTHGWLPSSEGRLVA
jgi:hypothetical protein